MDEEDLAAAIELAGDPLFYQTVVPGFEEGEHRGAVAGRRLHQRHVAQAGKRLVQGARDRRGGEREDVGLELELLEPFLVLHAEAVFLVHDDQAELLELHVLAEQAVRADHDIHGAGGEFGERLFLLLPRLEAAHHRDAHREVREAVAEGAAMLLGEHRGGDKHRDLATALDGLECGAHGDLRLAIAHVADQEAVHGTRVLHVLLHTVGGGALVGGVLEEERTLELLLPGAVGMMRRAVRDLAARVEIEQLGRHLDERGTGALLLRGPAPAAEFVEAGRGEIVGDIAGGAVLLDLVEPIERDVESVAPLVLDHRDLDGGLAVEDRGHAAVYPDAMLEMHHVVARLERRDMFERGAGRVLPAAADAAVAAEDLVVGEDAESTGLAARRDEESSAEHADHEGGG